MDSVASHIFTMISFTGKLTRPVRTIEAKDRHEALAIAQSLYPDSDLAVVCNEEQGSPPWRHAQEGPAPC